MTSFGKIFKEVKEINKTSVFDDQATIEMDETNPLKLKLDLTPKHGFFKGTRIKFLLILPENYPDSKATAQCLNQIFHPNFKSGKICFSMFQEDWSPEYRIESYINGLLWLISNPNHESPLSTDHQVKNNEFEYKRLVNHTVKGGQVKGLNFDNILETVHTFENNIFKKLTSFSFSNEWKYDDFEFMIQKMEKSKMKYESLITFKRDHKSLLVSSFINENQCQPNQLIKSVVFINSKNFPIVVVTNGYDQINLESLKSLVNDKKLRLATRDEIKKYLGCRQYCIPVFDIQPKKATIFVNKRIEKIEDIYLESGIEYIYMKMKSKDFLKNENFKLEEIDLDWKPKNTTIKFIPKTNHDVSFRFVIS